MLVVRFWGVRGSIPVPGSATTRMGGNTSCVEVRAGSEILIFDAGTGARLLGNALLQEQPITARMFFTHVHWDHIQGFPFFAPAFEAGNRFDLYGGNKVDRTLAEILRGQMNFLNFPVSLDQMGSEMAFNDLDEDTLLSFGDVTVSIASLSHPGGVYAYRVECGGHAVVFATDVEHGTAYDQKLVDLARDVDLLIYDAMYTPEEYEGIGGVPSRRGWGHSTWEQGIQVARSARARRLVLFHHDPDHDDQTILDMESQARQEFPHTDAAYEGLEICFPD